MTRPPMNPDVKTCLRTSFSDIMNYNIKKLDIIEINMRNKKFYIIVWEQYEKSKYIIDVFYGDKLYDQIYYCTKERKIKIY